MKRSIIELEAMITELLREAQDAGTSAANKKALLAEAAAYAFEISIAKKRNQTDADLDFDRINQNAQSYRAFLDLEINRDAPDSLAALSPMAFSSRMEEIADEYRQCAAPADFGMRINPNFQYQIKLHKDESIEYARTRAGQIFRQMDRTWRVVGSSTQFNAAKNAMQTVAQLASPKQLDFFTASLTVKAYVSKNLQAANSAVGRTRMACSMAFLKQIMDDKSFRAYCNQLNSLRGIKLVVSVEEGGAFYEKTNPRCFVPDEIGTVKEVYQNAKNRIRALAQAEEAPSPRELAMLTALKNLQARSPDGEDLVVEHEALQAEIEKIQASPYFQAVLQGPRDELLMMALEGNLDTIQGCQNGLSQEQKNRIAAERQKLADEQAKQEQAKREELLKKQQEEAIKKEQDRQREEQKKYEEENPLITDLYRKQIKVLDGMMHPLHNAFLQFESLSKVSLETKGTPEQESVELTATLIALAEHMDRLQKGDRTGEPRVNLAVLQSRVEDLKKDELIRQKGAQLMAEERWIQYHKDLMKQAREKGLSGERAEIYPAVQLGLRLTKEYQKGCEDRKLQKPRTVAAYYAGDIIRKMLDHILDMRSTSEETLKTVAAVFALREHEKRLGPDALVEPQFLANRSQRLMADPDVIAASRQLTQPETNERLKQALGDRPNRVQAFGEFLETLCLERKQELEGPSGQQKSQEQSVPKPGGNREEQKPGGEQHNAKRKNSKPRPHNPNMK